MNVFCRHAQLIGGFWNLRNWFSTNFIIFSPLLHYCMNRSLFPNFFFNGCHRIPILQKKALVGVIWEMLIYSFYHSVLFRCFHFSVNTLGCASDPLTWQKTKKPTLQYTKLYRSYLDCLCHCMGYIYQNTYFHTPN